MLSCIFSLSPKVAGGDRDFRSRVEEGLQIASKSIITHPQMMDIADLLHCGSAIRSEIHSFSEQSPL